MHVKICGLRSPEEAAACAQLGVSSIGLNFVPGSPRCVDVSTARRIADAVREVSPRVVLVAVVADMAVEDMRALVQAAGLDCLQLHGDEPPEVLTPLLPHAYKALRIGGAEDVARARLYPGEHLLVDAKVAGALGGTGTAFEWTLVRDLARERRLTLAGGLTPESVAEAIRVVRPYCVDVASGVEHAPGVKDLGRVRAFLAAAREA